MKFLLLMLMSVPAFAAQVCTNVYNPHSMQWEYQCVEGRTPQCRQEYDALNRRWVTVC